jgi:hypothetical protein
MKEYAASRLAQMGVSMGGLFHGWELLDMHKKLNPSLIKIIIGYLETVSREGEFLGLTLTAKYAERIKESINNKAPEPDDYGNFIKTLQGRLDDELESITLFYLPSDKMSFYQKTELFGLEFKTNFPKANVEVIEAGNCIAFARHTAAIFHLMRALEIGIFSLFTFLGINLPEKDGDKNWNCYFRIIKEKIAENDKSKAADTGWQTDKEFAQKALAFFESVRNPLRNSTMHVDVTYDEGGAEMVFNSIKGFMQHLATRLKE